MSKTDKMKLRNDIFLLLFFLISGAGALLLCIQINNSSLHDNSGQQMGVIILWIAILFIVFYLSREKTEHRIKKFKSESPISDLQPNDFGYKGNQPK